MKNKNLLIMKQPALGKKITELRKQKGLTQEELVEKCKINVRTIQRIEAGETMPRSFTIKTILEALDADFNIDNFTDETEITNEDRKVLNLAWVFGFVYFVFGFIETIADLYTYTDSEFKIGAIPYTIIKIISSITFVLFFRGFIKVAKIYSHKLLEVVVYVFMVLYVLAALYDVFLINSSEAVLITSGVLELIVFGVVQIIFGITLLQLKTKLGAIVQVNGFLEIVVGICLATVLLASLGLFLLIPTVLIEIIVIYKVARKK